MRLSKRLTSNDVARGIIEAKVLAFDHDVAGKAADAKFADERPKEADSDERNAEGDEEARHRYGASIPRERNGLPALPQPGTHHCGASI